VSHDKDADRMNLFRRQFVRLSALSTLDGSVVDYHGVYGCPKEGELCLYRVKPEETLVEARSGSDVQIDRQICIRTSSQSLSNGVMAYLLYNGSASYF